MHLNLIIQHWPADAKPHSRWTRATRAAKQALKTDDVSSSMEVTEEEMRLIVREIPARAEGVEEAFGFLDAHNGFPAQEWVRMCDASSPKSLGERVESLEEEFREDMSKLDQILPEFQRWIEALEEKIEVLEERLDQIAP